MRGVSKTPPPIPPVTAMLAMAKPSKKEFKSRKRAKLFRNSRRRVSAPFDMSARAIYERVTATLRVVNSSQEDLSRVMCQDIVSTPGA